MSRAQKHKSFVHFWGRGTVPRKKIGESLLSPNVKSNAWGPAGGQAAARATQRNSGSGNERSVRHRTAMFKKAYNRIQSEEIVFYKSVMNTKDMDHPFLKRKPLLARSLQGLLKSVLSSSLQLLESW